MTQPLTTRPDSVNVRLAAVEILLQRMLSALEQREPGFLEGLSGHYALKSAPDSGFDAFLGEVDEAMDNLLALARAEAKRP